MHRKQHMCVHFNMAAQAHAFAVHVLRASGTQEAQVRAVYLMRFMLCWATTVARPLGPCARACRKKRKNRKRIVMVLRMRPCAQGRGTCPCVANVHKGQREVPSVLRSTFTRPVLRIRFHRHSPPLPLWDGCIHCSWPGWRTVVYGCFGPVQAVMDSGMNMCPLFLSHLMQCVIATVVALLRHLIK